MHALDDITHNTQHAVDLVCGMLYRIAVTTMKEIYKTWKPQAITVMA